MGGGGVFVCARARTRTFACVLTRAFACVLETMTKTVMNCCSRSVDVKSGILTVLLFHKHHFGKSLISVLCASALR